MLAKFMKHLSCFLILIAIELLLNQLLLEVTWCWEDLTVDTTAFKDHLIGSESSSFVCENKLNLAHLLNEVAVPTLGKPGFFVVNRNIFADQIWLPKFHNLQHHIERNRDHMRVSDPEDQHFYDKHVKTRVLFKAEIGMTLCRISLPDHWQTCE